MRDGVRGLIALMTALLAAYAQAAACSCIGSRSHEQSFRAADIVFEGVAVETVRDDTVDDFEPYRTTFRVTRPIKGRAVGTRSIIHPVSSAGCGQVFEPGTSYRIYAYGEPGDYSTGACTLTARLDLPDTWRPTELELVAEANEAEDIDDLRGVVSAISYETRTEETEAFLDDYAERFADLDQSDPNDRRWALRWSRDWDDKERLTDLLVLEVTDRPTRLSAALELADIGVSNREPGRTLAALSTAAAALPDDMRLKAARMRVLLAAGRDVVLTGGSFAGGRYPTVTLPARSEKLDLSGTWIGRLDGAGVSARGLRLAEAQVAGDLSGADLTGAVLTRIGQGEWPPYQGPDLTLAEARLRGADLREANLIAVTLHDADLRDVRGAEASLSEADLSGARLDGADLRGADLSRVDLTGARLPGAVLDGAILRAADIAGVDLRKARLDGTDLLAARADCRTRLPTGAQGVIIAPPACGRTRSPRDFTGWDFSDAGLERLDLTGAVFDRARFGAMQGGRRWEGTILRRARFEDITAASFERFSGAVLDGAVFRDVKGRVLFEPEVEWEDTGEAVLTPAPSLRGTRFEGFEIEADTFYSDAPDPGSGEHLVADLSEAAFANMTVTCDTAWQRRTVARLGGAGRLARQARLAELAPDVEPILNNSEAWETSPAVREYRELIWEDDNLREAEALLRAEAAVLAAMRAAGGVTVAESCSAAPGG